MNGVKLSIGFRNLEVTMTLGGIVSVECWNRWCRGLGGVSTNGSELRSNSEDSKSICIWENNNNNKNLATKGRVK